MHHYSSKHTSVGIGLERGNEVIAIARPLTRRSLSSVRRRRRATTDVSALIISWMASSALASACACSSRSSSTSIASSVTCGAVVCTVCDVGFRLVGSMLCEQASNYHLVVELDSKTERRLAVIWSTLRSRIFSSMQLLVESKK
jgi:transcription elongation factor Elf1